MNLVIYAPNQIFSAILTPGLWIGQGMWHTSKRSAPKILVRNPERSWLLGKPTCMWHGNMKMILKK